MPFESHLPGNAFTLRPQPGSLEYINRPNPVEPSDLSHGTFDGSTRELDRTTNEQLHPFLLGDRTRQRNDLAPEVVRLARHSPHKASHSSLAAVLNDDESFLEHTSNRRDLDQAIFTLPKLPAKRHAKRHRVPPVLQGLHQPPPDAGLLPSMSTEESQVFLSTSRGNKRAAKSDSNDDTNISTAVQQESAAYAEPIQEGSEKRSKRNLWSDQETDDLLAGVARFGIGNWKKILFCSDFKFHKRTAVDLKDRFRVCRPDVYGGTKKTKKSKRKSLEEATNKSPKKSRVSKAAEIAAHDRQDDSSVETLWKAQRRPRRNFTDEEDQALLRGFREQGPSWVSIARYEVFKEHNRTPTDLRDRLRTKFPERYAQAGLAARPAVPKPAKRTKATRQEPEKAVESAQAVTPTSTRSNDNQDRLERTTSRTGLSFPLPLPSIGDTLLPNFNFPDDDEDADPIVLDRSIMDWANNHMPQLNRQPQPQFPENDPLPDNISFPGIDPLVTLKLPKPGFF